MGDVELNASTLIMDEGSTFADTLNSHTLSLHDDSKVHSVIPRGIANKLHKSTSFAHLTNNNHMKEISTIMAFDPQDRSTTEGIETDYSAIPRDTTNKLHRSKSVAERISDDHKANTTNPVALESKRDIELGHTEEADSEHLHYNEKFPFVVEDVKYWDIHAVSYIDFRQDLSLDITAKGGSRTKGSKPKQPKKMKLPEKPDNTIGFTSHQQKVLDLAISIGQIHILSEGHFDNITLFEYFPDKFYDAVFPPSKATSYDKIQKKYLNRLLSSAETSRRAILFHRVDPIREEMMRHDLRPLEANRIKRKQEFKQHAHKECILAMLSPIASSVDVRGILRYSKDEVLLEHLRDMFAISLNVLYEIEEYGREVACRYGEEALDFTSQKNLKAMLEREKVGGGAGKGPEMVGEDVEGSPMIGGKGKGIQEAEEGVVADLHNKVAIVRKEAKKKLTLIEYRWFTEVAESFQGKKLEAGRIPIHRAFGKRTRDRKSLHSAIAMFMPPSGDVKV